jgi:hypothetical protein
MRASSDDLLRAASKEKAAEKKGDSPTRKSLTNSAPEVTSFASPTKTPARKRYL